MWHIRLSATCAVVNTHELVVNHSENIYAIIPTAVFYYNPMISTISVSSLCGQNCKQQILFSVCNDKTNI